MAKPRPDNGKLILALNGCEGRVRLVLGRVPPDGEASVLHGLEFTAHTRGNTLLAPSLENLFTSAGVKPGDLAGIACVRGPGSFTGLRLVLGFALGLSKASDAPLAGLDYLPLLAAKPCAMAGGTVWVMTHARRTMVHMQGFAPLSDNEVLPSPVSVLDALSLDEAAWRITSGDGPQYVLGSGLERHYSYFAQALDSAGSSAKLLGQEFNHPGPEVLLKAASRAVYSPRAVEPLYLRASDAELNLESFAQSRGLDPEAARALFTRLTTS